MPLLPAIGRRSPRLRTLIALLYALLLAGAAATVLPLLRLVAGSTRTGVDAAEPGVWPAFLTDDAALYRKTVESLFNESIASARMTYGVSWPSFAAAAPPPRNPALAAAWRAFLAGGGAPDSAFTPGHLYLPVTRGALPSALRAFRRELFAACGDDLAKLNRELGQEFPDFASVQVRPDDPLARHAPAADDAWARRWADFKSRVPPDERLYASVEGFFRQGYLQARYSRDIAAYNASHGTRHADWLQVRLTPRPPPAGAAARGDWEFFVRHLLNLQWLRLDASAAPAWEEFQRARHDAAHAEMIPLPDSAPAGGAARADWEAFLRGWTDPGAGRLYQAPIEAVRIIALEFQFRDWLRARYGTLENAQRALGAAWASWEDAPLPQAELHYENFLARRSALRFEFATRNLRSVADYVLRHGRAAWNTAVYCGAAVLLALLVNPLAAYALSRFRPRRTYAVLLFLMLTMAFPPMVTQIPSFLLLREFGLLNTYWALLLPGLANGYTIFLLKGFFDALPRELYESAAIDGAGELRMFWHFTLGMSGPILAVTALGAFTTAYGNFLLALLVCQDPRMWTLMPWLYQLQQDSGVGVVYASLLVAAVPTLIVFLLCQRVILRGIVIPVEK